MFIISIISVKKEDPEEKRTKCLKCEYNREGFCSKYSQWCSKAKIECGKCSSSQTYYYDKNGIIRMKKEKLEKKKRRKYKTKY